MFYHKNRRQSLLLRVLLLVKEKLFSKSLLNLLLKTGSGQNGSIPIKVRGDQLGNQSHGFGWPYGPVALVTPFSFSFPVKIPAVQLMGALYMGIKLVLRVDKNSEN
ncbi:putative L-glutamate gamma-semialdehyde dehydrogenase [Helianthus annuus]|nr:putative L-glutamate gamma-semialdehyde dehydrogenase [Helianthus annuus]KAJ0618072.1 putative L-glutamate gamma-semialdehyde dehydrogenase [Helianthus annuus]KAJ0730913.1 putative L-glutamate gamma-semialdehyde dehydrogenase [Helianthus annuus]